MAATALGFNGMFCKTRRGYGTMTFRTCLRSAARRRYGVENVFEMLMYHAYIPLSQPFSPCLALAREIVNTFFREANKVPDAALRRLAVLKYCLRRRTLPQP